MVKVLTVMLMEYRQAIFSKTFIISICLMPFVLGLMIGIQVFSADARDLADRSVVVVDKTGRLEPALASAARNRNRQGLDSELTGKQDKARVLLEFADPPATDADEDALINDLSDQIRDGNLFAFVIIGADVISPDNEGDTEIAYYSNSPTFMELPDWLRGEIRSEIESIRFNEAGIERAVVTRLQRTPPMERYVVGKASGDDDEDSIKKENPVTAFLVPLGAMMMIFVTVNMSAPLMLNTVMEEKMNKIAEILIASVSPFQLMMGKLLSGTMIGLTYACIYSFGLIAMLLVASALDVISFSLILWMFVFLVLALLTYGSIWGMIGAACSEIKDTQNFAGLTALIIIIPVAVIGPVLESPNGPFAQVVSLIPPFTPMLMLMRMGVEPGPPLWQVLLSLVLTSGFAASCVWAAGKVFRIGLLSQGESPGIRQLIRWIFAR